MQFIVETELDRMQEVVRELHGATLIGERGVLLNLGLTDLINAYKRAVAVEVKTQREAFERSVHAPSSSAAPSPQADGDGSPLCVQAPEAADPEAAVDWRGPLFRAGRAR